MLSHLSCRHAQRHIHDMWSRAERPSSGTSAPLLVHRFATRLRLGGYPSSNRTCGFPAYGFPCETVIADISSDNRHFLSRFQTFHFTRRTPSHPRALPRFFATMGSSDSSLRFRACEVSQVPDRTFDTRPPTIPRPLSMPHVASGISCRLHL